MSETYTRINWKDGENGGTPISADNLNLMDLGIEKAHQLIEELKENGVGGVTEEQLKNAVDAYFIKNPIQTVSDIFMRVSDGYIQFSTDNLTWKNVIAVSELKGQTGKTAYEYAKDGGYTGTEEEFAKKLAQENPTREEFSQLSDTVNDHESRIKAVENNTSVSGNGATTAQANSLWNVLKKTAFVEPLTDEEITALKTAWGITDSGEVEPDEPEEPDVPEVTLTSISATYTGGDVVVGTSINSLTGITVKATYSDGSIANVTGYTLSGDILVGENTITVSYGGKTTTFTVTGIAESSGDPVDTSPQIAEYDKGFYWGSQMETSDYTGACVTIPYEFEQDIDSLKLHSDYDAENDYMTGANMFPKVTYYIPNTKFLENGNSVASTKTKIGLYRDETIVAINSMTVGEEKTTEFGGKNDTNKMYVNGIAFTLFTDDVEDSYAYWTIGSGQIAPIGVNNGDIIFAGKNTQYYGMKNIDGTMA